MAFALPKKLKPYHAWLVGAFLLTLFITGPRYLDKTPFTFLSVALPRETWLVIPILAAAIAHRVMNASKPALFTKNEIPMVPTEELLIEWINSGHKARYGPSCDRVKTLAPIPFRRTGDVAFLLEMEGEKWVLFMDGRVNPPNDNRAYALMQWDKLHQFGFNSLYDVEKKLGRLSDNPLSQLMSEMEPDELSDFFKATGGRSGLASELK